MNIQLRPCAHVMNVMTRIVGSVSSKMSNNPRANRKEHCKFLARELKFHIDKWADETKLSETMLALFLELFEVIL